MIASRFRITIAALAVSLGVFLAFAGQASAVVSHEFEGSFNGSDAPEGSLAFVTGVAVDASSGASDGDVYLGHSNPSAGFSAAVDKFDADGTYAGVHIDGSATPQGSFGFISFATFRTSSIAVDGSSANPGDVYIADIAHGVVDRFNEDGSFDCQITAKDPASRSAAEEAAECDGIAGSETPQGSIEPTGITVDPVGGEVYVADAASEVIDVFAPSGEYLEQIADSHITNPTSLAAGSDGALYVAAGPGALKFEGGSFAATIDENGEEVKAVAVDPESGHVEVLRSTGGGEPDTFVAEYSASGHFLGTFGHGHAGFVFTFGIGPTGRVYLADGGVASPAEAYIFGPDRIVPNVTTEGVVGLTGTTAELTGEAAPDNANGGGDVTACEFQYVEEAEYEPSSSNPYSAGQSVPCAQPTPYSSPTSVSAEATGLTQGTNYHYRLVAADAEGTGEGEDRVFALGKPAVGPGRSIARTTGATVSADINPFSYETTCEVEYVDQSSFEASEYEGAATAPCEESLVGFGDQTAAVKLSGLTIGTHYHYRFVATNQAGTTVGEDQEFSTFGIESFSVEMLDPEGNPYVDEATSEPYIPAGGHPYEMKVAMEFTATEPETSRNEGSATGNLKTVRVRLPAGLIGNPTAAATCTSPDMLNNKCAPAAQVGSARSDPPRNEGISNRGAVFNLSPSAGVAAQLGVAFNTYGMVKIDASVRTGSDYGINTETVAITASEAVKRFEIEIWGVPADERHSPDRQCRESLLTGCLSDAPLLPFLTMPTSCTGPLTSTLSVDTWQESGNFVSRNAPMPSVDGCERLHFDPSMMVRPDVRTSESPTGLHVDLHVPQNQNPAGLAEANLKDATVELPAGLAVNPAGANGLAGCSPNQIELHGPNPAACPDAAKIGTVEVDTPLLDHSLPGAVYVATPHDNPFGSLLAIYIAVDDPQSGVVVKLAGEVKADPQTGQLTTTFKENPQVPFEDFRLNFFGGPQAALMTPQTCGEYETTTDMTPWSENGDAHPFDKFQIGSGPNGSQCANTPAEAPNSPAFSAGTVTPLAGAYTPFVLNLDRQDGSQRFSAIDTQLPPGLVGRLAGIPYCPDAALAAAAAKGGNEELASPSCPAASQVGTVNVGAGAGSQPYHVTGKAYLTGPYKGAPLGLAIVTPAVAGPFDLGAVVVRTALYVDPETARITAKSDPLPTILQGIPLDVRSIALRMDRPEFTLNPTSCEPMSVTGTAFSVLGQAAPLSNRFQVGGCGDLGFKPKLALSLKGGTERAKHPALRAILRTRAGEANIARAQVALPHSEFLDNAHIKTICTRVQFAANQCPAASVYGHARAITPLLDRPLEGPVYLRSSSHQLPDLVADLNGQIHVVLDGRIDSVHGGIRSTFEAVPDAPVSKFVLEMQGGKKGLLQNSTNLCAATNRATTKFDGQNGKIRDFNPVLANSCGKKAKKARRHVKHRRRS